jgi:asparagine synthetase B (glutamine-hydrolysing)
MARGATHTEVDAITWSFGGRGDDRPYLNELCDELGIVPIRISSAEATARVVNGLIADAAPSIWPTNAALLLAHERARQRGAEAILTGLGGDQIFMGDPRVFAQHAVRGDWGEATRCASQLHGESRIVSLLRTARIQFTPALVSALPLGLSVRRKQYATHRWPWAGPRFREVIRDLLVHPPHDTGWRSLTNETKFRRLVSTELFEVAETRGQQEVATSIMRIDPLLDAELVSAVAGLPQELLLFGNRYRGFFRHAMRARLPERLRLRPDKGVFDPEIGWIVRGSDLKALRSLASMQMCGDLGLVDPRKFAPQFETVLADAEGAGWATIWPALAVEAFVRSQWGQKERTWQATA